MISFEFKLRYDKHIYEQGIANIKLQFLMSKDEYSFIKNDQQLCGRYRK